MKIDEYAVDASFWGWIKFVGYLISCSIGLTMDYIGVPRELLYTLTALMISDWVTGIIKAWKLKIPITSKRSNKGILEKFVLLLIPISVGLVLKVVGVPINLTMKGAFSLLLMAELYSFIGNCYCIYTGEDEKEYDAMTAVIKYIRNILFKFFEKVFKE